jgi:hypothetical protein
MVAITGNLWLDNIIIPIITGGGIISLIGILFDKLAKKRAEYIDIVHRRIERFQRQSQFMFKLQAIT